MGIKWIVFEAIFKILAIRALSDINRSASPRVLNPIKHSCSYIKQYVKLRIIQRPQRVQEHGVLKYIIALVFSCPTNTIID